MSLSFSLQTFSLKHTSIAMKPHIFRNNFKILYGKLQPLSLKIFKIMENTAVHLPTTVDKFLIISNYQILFKSGARKMF